MNKSTFYSQSSCILTIFLCSWFDPNTFLSISGVYVHACVHECVRGCVLVCVCVHVCACVTLLCQLNYLCRLCKLVCIFTVCHRYIIYMFYVGLCFMHDCHKH